MRFIHTADWHLGNQMHDIDRLLEAEHFLLWLGKKIKELKADCLIISGDVFDTVNPPTSSRRQYYHFLSTLSSSGCGTVVITGGNHDSAVMLEAAGDLLDVLDIHVIGSINNKIPEELVVSLKDAGGSERALCLAVPFVRETELNAYSDSDEKDLYEKAFSKLYEDVYNAALKLRGEKNIPIIATGHLYAADLEGRLSGSSSSVKSDDGVKVLDVLGTLGNVPPKVFPPCEYTALGHIHYSSRVAKNDSIRYSGSPFVLGFDEAQIERCVLCVDVEKDGEIGVQKIEYNSPFVFKRLCGTLDELKSGLENFTSLQSDKEIFLELCYKKSAGLSARDFLEDAVSNLPQNVHVVSWKVLENENSFDLSHQDFDAEEVKSLEDEDVFSELILRKSLLDPSSDEAKDLVKKFLPLFLEVARKADSEGDA